MRCYYREKKYYCGAFLDVQIFPVYRKQSSRGKKAKPTNEIQAKLNNENAARKLVRLLHTNFTPADLELHLTYTDENLPDNDERAKKDVQNFIRRAKRFYNGSGVSELKYIWVTEQGSKSGRYHHHITISGGVDRTELERLWRFGYANSKALQFTTHGLAGLAHYITKAPLFYKRWSGSRNLQKPIERATDYKITHVKAKELASNESRAQFEALFPGYFVAEVSAQKNEHNGGFYISTQLYKKSFKIMQGVSL